MIAEKFLEIVNSAPLVSVDFIVTNTAGQVLLGKRTNRPAQSCWFVPGGRILKDERIDEAVIRISERELGYQINQESAKFFGTFEHFYPDNFAGVSGVSTHYVVLAYRFVLNIDTSLKTDDQHSELKWWPVDQLLVSSEVHDYTKSYAKKMAI